MLRFAISCCAIAWAAALPARAQGNPDLMKTPQCAAARQQLDAAFAAGPRERIAAARERAALACFGIKPAAPPEGRFAAPPAALEPIRLRPEPALAHPPSAAGKAQTPVPPPAVAVPRPPVVTSCDPAGCWDSEGRRYNQQGPVLLGPTGVCTLQGGLLNCP
jgi:hypothetical protein